MDTRITAKVQQHEVAGVKQDWWLVVLKGEHAGRGNSETSFGFATKHDAENALSLVRHYRDIIWKDALAD